VAKKVFTLCSKLKTLPAFRTTRTASRRVPQHIDFTLFYFAGIPRIGSGFHPRLSQREELDGI
jgi:hypothetical protein